MTSHKKQSAAQEALAHTREIQREIEESLVLLDNFCQQHAFNINVPELFANDSSHTAEMTWGTDVGFKRAEQLTQLFNKTSNLKRLKIEFVGNYNIKED